MYSTEFDYIYICLFLSQVFLIMISGSYINILIFIIVWTIYFMRVHSHSIIVTILVAFSVTFQLYSLSKHTKNSLFATPHYEHSCYMSGALNLEDLAVAQNQCSTSKYQAFINNGHYELVSHPDMHLLYSNETTGSSFESQSCSELGVYCFSWNIRVPQISDREFEPCWNLVDEISIHNGKDFFVTSINAVKMRPDYRRVGISGARYLFVDISQRIAVSGKNPTTITDWTDSNTIPDIYSRFIVTPLDSTLEASITTHLLISCDPGQAHAKSHQTGALFFSVISDTVPFSLIYAFSQCESYCQPGTLSIIVVYMCNLCFSVISLHLSHDCQYKKDFSEILVYFWLTTCVIIFNWIGVFVILVVCYMDKVQGNFLVWTVRTLHIVQFLCIMTEFTRNRFGQNLEYIMVSHMSISWISALILPFKRWDHTIYFENCMLYFVSNVYLIHPLYLRNRIPKNYTTSRDVS
jgi:hypothetical protein